MGVESEYVYVVYCDGHEDDDEGVRLEDHFDECHWESWGDWTYVAKRDGWVFEGTRSDAKVWCPDCVTKQREATIPAQIPGQLDLLGPGSESRGADA